MWVVWDDPAIDWERFDLVVVRSAWDYAERWQDFLHWAELVPRIENPLSVLRFGVDKERYFTVLRDRGVPILDTGFCHSDEVDEFEPRPDPFVVKPAISAGGRRSARFEGGDETARALVAEIAGGGDTAMVQPLIEDAEISLVFIDGRYSHSLSRRAALPLGGAADDVLYLAEQLGPHDATAQERRTAEAALAVVPSPILYARVDLLGGVVLELEVVEPSLYLSFSPSAADKLSAAVATRLKRT